MLRIKTKRLFLLCHCILRQVSDELLVAEENEWIMLIFYITLN